MAHDFLSQVYLLANVPMTYEGENKLLFSNPVSQWAYFETKKKMIANTSPPEYLVFNEQSYIRQHKGSMRVRATIQNCRDCNYLMFQNTAYEDYWYYAYIDSVEYINDEVVEIFFTIDPIQTFMFKYDFEQCMIVRQHTISDNYFEHHFPENLDLGNEYVINNDGNALTPTGYTFYDCTPNQIVIVANHKLTNQSQIDSYVQSLPTGVKYSKNAMVSGNFCPCTIFSVSIVSTNDYSATRQNMSDILAMLIETEIICIYLCNSRFGQADTQDDYHIDNVGFSTYVNTTSLDGYTPKNKKLFTYPYTEIQINNMAGNVAHYKLEDWGSVSHVGDFKCYGSNFTIPTIYLVPTNYRNMPVNWEDGIGFSNYPQCAWGGDAFKAYFAQHLYENSWGFGNAVGDLVTPPTPSIGDALTFFRGGMGGMLSVAMKEGQKARTKANNVIDYFVQKLDLKRTPVNTYGNSKYNNLFGAIGLIGFTFHQLCIKAAYAKMIDEYFHMYGYTVNTCRKPNIHTRQKWTYIQTAGCQLRGTYDEHGIKVEAPASYVAEIESLYDSGLRFWYMTADGSGNYDDSGVGVYRSGDTLIDNNPL